MRVRKRNIVTVAGIASYIGVMLLMGAALPPSVVPPTNDPIGQKPPAPRHATDEGMAPGQSISSSDKKRKTKLASVALTSPSSEQRTPPGSFIMINDKTYPLRTYKALGVPTDPLANQWWYQQADLPAMWDIPSGAHQTTIAVIDTGFALKHEDLAGRWYTNAQESGVSTDEAPSRLNCSDQSRTLDKSCNLVDDNLDGVVDNETGVTASENPSELNCSDSGLALDRNCNRIDDDDNGYIDDVSGWDFVDQHSSVQAGKLNASGDSTTHGTMVAGTAAATGNNDKGIAGANWQANILPLQAMDDDGYGDTRTVGDAILYAAHQGVDVISLSLGTVEADPYVEQAIEVANAAGVLVVAAAGNDGCDCILYPAAYPEVLAVGALDTDGTRASFSSWGAELDIMAPGVNMTLPSWSSASPTNRYVSGAAGTSFATPLVAGVAAALRSQSLELQPLHLIAALTEQSVSATTAPRTSEYGYGSVKAGASLARVTAPDEPFQTYALTPTLSGAQYEHNGHYGVQECTTGHASTPVYELKKTTTHLFSMSRIEVRKLQASGYTASVFAHLCQRLPHDTPANIREINLFSEFRNIYRKQN